jgi:L-alanine-DL-glutamate epimerase-like enolase superfamily enzyme
MQFNKTAARGRRSFLKKTAGAFAAGVLGAEALEAYPQNTNTNSKPSDLKITDLRCMEMGVSMAGPLIRIDTNQGIYGLGEVRDGSSKHYALELKSRILGENPCNVDKIFRKIKQFGGHSRQAGGVCAVEMACWDLAGKAYNVPIWQMLGGKFRDKIRIYADTPESHDPKDFATKLRGRREAGFTWLKMDLGMDMVAGTPGTITMPAGTRMDYNAPVEHSFTATELTDKGIAMMAEYVNQVREIVGYDIPISSDHFGHMGVNSCIRLGKALTKYNLSWLEDMIPWFRTDLLKQISSEIDIPIATGEDIYLKEPFVELCRNHAVDIIQPDLESAGGILETKKIADMAQEYGVACALHCAATPVGQMASVHAAAAAENFLVLENHTVDVPYWQDLVNGVEKPIINKGFITVPSGPGLGVTLNEEVCKKYLRRGTEWFAPTDEWNRNGSNDRIWS